jgi:hypothetical protein
MNTIGHDGILVMLIPPKFSGVRSIDAGAARATSQFLV